jgi:hypothetical protein
METGEGVGVDQAGLGLVRCVHRAMMQEKAPPRCVQAFEIQENFMQTKAESTHCLSRRAKVHNTL